MKLVRYWIPALRVTKQSVCCEYRYYGMLGSFRQQAITRPLFTRTQADFIKLLEEGRFEFVVVLTRDTHWLREYNTAWSGSDNRRNCISRLLKVVTRFCFGELLMNRQRNLGNQRPIDVHG